MRAAVRSSGILSDASSTRVLDDRPQRTVHLFEASARTLEQPVRGDVHQDASEVLALPEERLARADGLESEHVLTVEEAWQTEVSEPSQFPGRRSLLHRRPKCHRTSIGRVDAHLESGTDRELAGCVPYEWIPFRVLPEVGQNSPNPFRCASDCDLSLDAPHPVSKSPNA